MSGIRRLGHLALNAGLRVLGVLAVLVAFAIPVGAFYLATHSGSETDEGPTSAQVAIQVPKHPEELRHMPMYRNGVIVLCYHNIAPRSASRYTVTPHSFAAQMAALRASGFHTISAARFAAFIAGKPVAMPSRALLVTFDDGTKGIWTYADPVLRRLSMQATSFIITGFVGHHQPYYLTWQEIEAMKRDRHWSFGSHTHLGHGLVKLNDRGATGPFLTNREWLPRKARRETLAEYRRRVGEDLDQSIERMLSHRLPRPRLFAYPFSSSEATDRPAGRALTQMLTKRFPARFDNWSEGKVIHRGEPSPLHRTEVHQDTTVRWLLERLRRTILRDRREAAEEATS